ncbi:MAG: choice-of-anchor D domain-containing protein [Planctomycetes bacterium]|nr:choice-of-anchor D domain-containing protein [Planctomycetota bacterium]
MARSSWSIVFIGMALFLNFGRGAVFAGGVRDKFLLSLKGQSGPCGGEVTVQVCLDFITKKKPVSFSYGVRHDPKFLKIKGVQLGKSVDLATHGARHCEFISEEGVTSQVVGCPVLTIGEGNELLRITYSLLGPPGTTKLTFADDLPGPLIDRDWKPGVSWVDGFAENGGYPGGGSGDPEPDLCQAELDSVPIQINLDKDGLTIIIVPETLPGMVTIKCSDIAVDAEAVDFGEVVVGDARAKTVTITNSGNEALVVSGLMLGEGSSAEFLIHSSPALPVELAPQASMPVEIGYHPADLGLDSGSLVIKSDDGDEPVVTVALTGAGVPVPIPEIEVVPLVLDFGEAFVGDSETLVVLVKNLGTAPLQLKSFSLAEGSSPDFSASSDMDPPLSLAPKACIGILVHYAPKEAGEPDAGILAIESDDADEPRVEVALSGRGTEKPKPEIVVSTDMLNFGEVFLGDSSELSSTITNTGSGVLKISGLALGSGTSPDFALFDGHALPIDLAPSASVDVKVKYTPTAEESDSGTVVVRSDDSDEPEVVVSLIGSGVPRPVPEIEVDQTPLHFGNVFIGDSSSLKVAIVNAGSAPLLIKNVFLGESSPDFALTECQTLPIELVPNGGCDVEVTYSPKEEGSDTGTLVIESNDADEGAVIISLAGNGLPRPVADVDVQPLSHDFENVFVGESSELRITIANTGSAALTVSGIALGEGSSGDYSITSAPELPLVLEAGKSEDVQVAYKPSDIGSDSGTVAITSDDADEGAIHVSLMGGGVPKPVADVFVQPLSINFGDLVAGSSKEETITISNNGSADLHVSSIRLGEGTGLDYAITAAPEMPLTLAPGNQAEVKVTYAPKEVESDSGVVVISSDDANEPSVFVTLIGSGVSPIRADAGDDRFAPEGSLVTLDGSNSFTSCGEFLSFIWEQVSGPPAQDLTRSEDGGQITFTVPPIDGGDKPMVFVLTVGDACENEASDDVTVVAIDVDERAAVLSLRSAVAKEIPTEEGKRLIVFDGQIDWQTDLEDGLWSGVRFNIQNDSGLESLRQATIYRDSNDNGDLDEEDLALDSAGGVNPDNTVLFEFEKTLKKGQPDRFLLVVDFESTPPSDTTTSFLPALLLALGLIGLRRLCKGQSLEKSALLFLLVAVCLAFPALPVACHRGHGHPGESGQPLAPANEASFQLQGTVDVFIKGKTTGVAAKITGLPLVGPTIQID